MLEILYLVKQGQRPAPPFEPTHWVRTVRCDSTPRYARIYVDCNLSDPDCDLVGLVADPDDTVKIDTELDQNNFAPIIVPQALRVHYRGKFYYAGIKGVTISYEGLQDLRSVHNMDAAAVLMDIFADDVSRWLEGHSLAACPLERPQT